MSDADTDHRKKENVPVLTSESASTCFLYSCVKEDSVAEQFKALTRNPEVPSSSPLHAGYVGVYSILASLPASCGF